MSSLVTKEEAERVSEAIAAAERKTSGEIVAMITEDSDGYTYAPLLWARGDLELRGGRGQGILLVDGDLVVSQGAEFHGVVITRDERHRIRDNPVLVVRRDLHDVVQAKSERERSLVHAGVGVL